MNIDEVFNDIIRFNKEIENKLNNSICLKECIYSFEVIYEDVLVRLIINCYTLDILNHQEVPRSLSRKLFVLTEDYEPICNSKRTERRTFCDFLFLKYGKDYDTLLFLDRESPDYIVYRREFQYAYEVVEAINPKEAQFNTMCRKNTGRARTKAEYDDYVSKKHKQYGESFSIEESYGALILSPYKGMVDTYRTKIQIVDAVIKKVRKYKGYKIDCDEKNIIVRYSTFGFDNKYDFEQVGNMISEIDEVNCSDINRIFVVSGMYGILVEYNRAGNLLSFSIDKVI